VVAIEVYRDLWFPAACQALDKFGAYSAREVREDPYKCRLGTYERYVGTPVPPRHPASPRSPGSWLPAATEEAGNPGLN
jgi:hypothetical protein